MLPMQRDADALYCVVCEGWSDHDYSTCPDRVWRMSPDPGSPAARASEGWCPRSTHPKLDDTGYCTVCDGRWHVSPLGLTFKVRVLKDGEVHTNLQALHLREVEMYRDGSDERLRLSVETAHREVQRHLAGVR